MRDELRLIVVKSCGYGQKDEGRRYEVECRWAAPRLGHPNDSQASFVIWS